MRVLSRAFARTGEGGNILYRCSEAHLVPQWQRGVATRRNIWWGSRDRAQGYVICLDHAPRPEY